MKKILKLLTVTNGLIIISFNGAIVTGCSLYGAPTSDRDYQVSLLRYGNLPANSTDFIKFYEKQLKTPASQASKQEFDNLYDNNPAPGAFTSYSQLTQELANTQMGPRKCQVNWLNLFNAVNLSGNKLTEAQNGILRFNNILAYLYGTINDLRLVQSNELNTTQGNVIAYTESTTNDEMQRMVFGPKFVDTSLINEQYQMGFWSTNNIDSVIIHEYGHALSNFIGVPPTKRDTYNNNWNWPRSYQSNLETTSVSYGSNNRLIHNLHAYSILDRAQALMDFLTNEGHKFAIAHNLSSYYDPGIASPTTYLFPYILLQSNYGRTYLRTGETKDEYFAEAFAAWLLTPENQRGWNWELFNTFFTEKLHLSVDKK